MQLHSKWQYLSHDRYGQFVLWTHLPLWDSLRGGWFMAEFGGKGCMIPYDTFDGMPQLPPRKYKLRWKIQRDDNRVYLEAI